MSSPVLRSAVDDGISHNLPAAALSADSTGARSATVIDTRRLTYPVDEVAYLLNLSRGVAYQHVRDGLIPAERIGRRWLIPRTRFHAWLDGEAPA